MMVTVATPTGSAICIRDVVKNYELAAGSFTALRRVNLEIADGEARRGRRRVGKRKDHAGGRLPGVPVHPSRGTGAVNVHAASSRRR